MFYLYIFYLVIICSFVFLSFVFSWLAIICSWGVFLLVPFCDFFLLPQPCPLGFKFSYSLVKAISLPFVTGGVDFTTFTFGGTESINNYKLMQHCYPHSECLKGPRLLKSIFRTESMTCENLKLERQWNFFL